ncbi:MAG: sigma-70 family RNA polymerase sigma factor [Planctomycetia bacterium]|nr:sigma-70 family RNA polymerase sigma factor [Planctomycetia bacterium]
MTDKKSSERESQANQKATRLFLQNYNYVRKVAFLAAPQRALTDDIVNDAFVDFVQKAETWDYSGNMPALLGSITRNIAKQYWRRYLRSLPESIQKIHEWLQCGLATQDRDEVEFEEELSRLRRCMDKLSPSHRSIIQRHYYDGISFVDLARDEQKNVKAVQKLASRIRMLLRDCIEAEPDKSRENTSDVAKTAGRGEK